MQKMFKSLITINPNMIKMIRFGESYNHSFGFVGHSHVNFSTKMVCLNSWFMNSHKTKDIDIIIILFYYLLESHS